MRPTWPLFSALSSWLIHKASILSQALSDPSRRRRAKKFFIAPSKFAVTSASERAPFETRTAERPRARDPQLDYRASYMLAPVRPQSQPARKLPSLRGPAREDVRHSSIASQSIASARGNVSTPSNAAVAVKLHTLHMYRVQISLRSPCSCATSTGIDRE